MALAHPTDLPFLVRSADITDLVFPAQVPYFSHSWEYAAAFFLILKSDLIGSTWRRALSHYCSHWTPWWLQCRLWLVTRRPRWEHGPGSPQAVQLHRLLDKPALSSGAPGDLFLSSGLSLLSYSHRSERFTQLFCLASSVWLWLAFK